VIKLSSNVNWPTRDVGPVECEISSFSLPEGRLSLRYLDVQSATTRENAPSDSYLVFRTDVMASARAALSTPLCANIQRVLPSWPKLMTEELL